MIRAREVQALYAGQHIGGLHAVQPLQRVQHICLLSNRSCVNDADSTALDHQNNIYITNCPATVTDSSDIRYCLFQHGIT